MGIEYYGGPRTLNGLAVETQTFAVASSGTDFGIASSGAAHTFNIPDASATARGLITTGAQTIAGAKTFSSQVIVPLGNNGTPSVLGVGTAAGIAIVDTNSMYAVIAGQYGVRFGRGGSLGVTVRSDSCFGFTSGNADGTVDAILLRDAAGTLAQRNSTNAQTFRLYNTYTSSTSFENLQFKAVAAAAYQIGSAIGSAGGTNRAIEIGHYNSAGTFTSALSISTGGVVTAGSAGIYTTSSYIGFLNKSLLVCGTDGNLKLSNWADNSFNILQFGGTTSSFPAIKRSSAAIALRLADDSADAALTCGAITATDHILTGAGKNIGTSGTTFYVGAFDGTTTLRSGIMCAGNDWVAIQANNNMQARFKYAGVLQLDPYKTIDWMSGTDFSSATVLVSLAPSADTLAQRNGTNAQTLRVYNTYTSATSYELLNLKGKAAANFEIGPENGSAGGTLRGLTIGGYAAGTTTIAPWLSFTNTGNAVLTNTVSTSGSPTALTLTGAAHTTLTLSTEATDVNFNLARTVQFATGALTTQRAMRIQAPTYGFVGASTITTASTLSISGPPVAGTNATITSAYVLNVESGTSNFGGEIILNSNKLTFGSSSLGGNVGAALVWTTNYTVGFRVLGEGTGRLQFSDSGITLNDSNNIAWTSSDDSAGTKDLYLYRDAAGRLAQRNSTNAQSFGVYGTWTSTSSYERINIRGKAAGSFEIGPESGNSGGTLRGLTIGGYIEGSETITPWLIFSNEGAATFSAGITALGLSGNNTGDQDLSSYLTSADAALEYVSQYTLSVTTLNGIPIGDNATFSVGTEGTDFTIESISNTHFFKMPDASETARGLITTETQTIAGAKTFSEPIASTKAIYFTSEPTGTPAGTTQTLTLADGNHQTLALTSATGTVTATLTVPTGASVGSILVRQHASAAKDIVWAVSAGTIKWMGAEPDWAADAINSVRIVSWRYNTDLGSVMYLGSTEVAV